MAKPVTGGLMLSIILLGALAFVAVRIWKENRDDACRRAVKEAFELLESQQATGYEWNKALQKAEDAIRTEEDRRLVHRLIAFESFMVASPEHNDNLGFVACMVELNNVVGPIPGINGHSSEEVFKNTEERLDAAEKARYEKMLPLVRQESDPSPCLEEWSVYQER